MCSKWEKALSVCEGKVKRFLGDRLAITLKSPTENIYTLTIWNDMEQVLCVGWFDGDAPRVICRFHASAFCRTVR